MRVRSFFSVKKSEKGGKMRSRKAQTAKESDTGVRFLWSSDSYPGGIRALKKMPTAIVTYH